MRPQPLLGNACGAFSYRPSLIATYSTSLRNSSHIPQGSCIASVHARHLSRIAEFVSTMTSSFSADALLWQNPRR
jgi:hypothetical protein